MVSDSIGALHVALAAALVGWLVFSISHAASVWRKRNNSGDRRGSGNALLLAGLLCCAAALVASWLGRELTRRAGVITGTDFYVARAHARTVPHLVRQDDVHQGDVLVSYESPENDRETEHLRGEILVLENQAAVQRLKPLILNPELLRTAREASDSQRARLNQLGYGALSTKAGGAIDEQALGDDELVGAELARSTVAAKNLVRMTSLVTDGVIARNQEEAAYAEAQSADQNLHERQRLIRAAKAGSADLAGREAAIRQDGDRANAERNAELAELNARITELRTSLLQLREETQTLAPFNGNVVYRHPSPALAGEGQVLLVLAKGAGFLGTVQLPANEASMLVLGQPLRMKLQRSLVSEEVLGRLQEIRLVPGYPKRRDLLIACELPPEQFAAYTSGVIPVLLLWRPPLYKDKLAVTGFLCLPVSFLAWLVLRRPAEKRLQSRSSGDESAELWTSNWSYSVKEQELHDLGVRLGQSLQDNAPSPEILEEVQKALREQPVTSGHLVRTGVLQAMRPDEHPVGMVPFAKDMKEEVDRTLAQLGLSDMQREEKPYGG